MYIHAYVSPSLYVHTYVSSNFFSAGISDNVPRSFCATYMQVATRILGRHHYHHLPTLLQAYPYIGHRHHHFPHFITVTHRPVPLGMYMPT
jgi:hypothetical protein